jgi:hypothetical protein
MTIWLLIFVMVIAADMAWLLTDVVLYECGLKTITAAVKDHPALGVPVVAFQVMGVVALILHFY